MAIAALHILDGVSLVRKKIGAAALVLAIAGPSAAADWRLAGESDASVSFIDMDSIAKNSGGVRFSRWMVMRSPLATGADNLRDTFEIDCATRRYKVVQLSFFTRTQLLRELSPSNNGVAEPGTVLHSASEVACGTRPAIGQAVADPYAFARERMGP